MSMFPFASPTLRLAPHCVLSTLRYLPPCVFAPETTLGATERHHSPLAQSLILRSASVIPHHAHAHGPRF